MAFSKSRIAISIPSASGDGLFHGRYPKGNAFGAALAGVALSASIAAGTLTTPPPSTTNYVGINLADVNYYSNEQPFLDVCKSASPWFPSSNTQNGPDMQVDANGYPMSMVGYGGTTYPSFYVLLNNALSLAPNASYIYPAGSYTVTATGNGILSLAFDAAAATNAPSSGCTISGTTLTITDGGTHSMVFSVNTPSSSGIKLSVSGVSSSAYMSSISVVQTSYVVSFQAGEIFHPLFKGMLNAIGYRRIRFMEWCNKWSALKTVSFTGDLPMSSGSGSLNASEFPNGWDMPTGVYPAQFISGDILQISCTFGSSAVAFSGNTTADCPFTHYYTAQAFVPYVQSWAARPVPANFRWSTNSGVPYEVCVQLCNEMTAMNGFPVDLWVNTFLAANTALMTDALGNFDTQLATYVKNNLGSTQKAYVEDSNEVWNGGDTNTNEYALTMGKIMFPSQSNNVYSGQEFYGVKTGQVAQIWKGVYGSTAFANQVKVSMGGQTGTPSGSAVLMNYAMMAPDWVALGNPVPYTQGIGAIHFAPYFGKIPTATDATQILSQPDGGLSMMFALMYSNTYNGYTVATGSGSSNTVDSAAGWIGYATSNMAGILATFAASPSTYPWYSGVSVEGYEMGSSFEVNGSTLVGAQATAMEALIASMSRDPRMQYCFYDPTGQLSSNPGYLAALKPLWHGGNHHWDVYPAGGQYGEWGAIESVMQPIPPAANAPAKAMGIYEFIAA